MGFAADQRNGSVIAIGTQGLGDGKSGQAGADDDDSAHECSRKVFGSA